MIPTRMQWKQWSLPAKYTIVGTCMAAIGLLLTILFFFVPSEHQNPLPLDTYNVDTLTNAIKQQRTQFLNGIFDQIATELGDGNETRDLSVSESSPVFG